MVSHENVSTVGQLMAVLMGYESDTPVKIRVDDGCGCCSSGGTLEVVSVEFDGKEIELN
ncbi:hypothetical protein HWB76_gp123 [Streptomyces phage Blueeyedbeauty]|uniref:Uncharacterized protein n=1 Tax=Streptomyces phage Blueeyedbeauty TaxID=2250336 RepID=A0A345L1X7_9CAUD|nr:hypothetical protein HWB76_gp123 [Streptomyces phage Blueeyedbeauty]AXH49279.1 hypothetical protein SEA_BLUEEYEDBEAUTY_163 [Streptomyces phage Blueeyedbeauty]